VDQLENNELDQSLPVPSGHSHSHRGFSPVTHRAQPKNNRFNGFANRRPIMPKGKPLKRFPGFFSGFYHRAKATV